MDQRRGQGKDGQGREEEEVSEGDGVAVSRGMG